MNRRGSCVYSDDGVKKALKQRSYLYHHHHHHQLPAAYGVLRIECHNILLNLYLVFKLVCNVVFLLKDDYLTKIQFKSQTFVLPYNASV